jgi:hypothetical protein
MPAMRTDELGEQQPAPEYVSNFEFPSSLFPKLVEHLLQDCEQLLRRCEAAAAPRADVLGTSGEGVTVSPRLAGELHHERLGDGQSRWLFGFTGRFPPPVTCRLPFQRAHVSQTALAGVLTVF